jgi:hypothetical protein
MNHSIIIDEEEQEILSAIENGAISGSGISDTEKKNLAKIATHTPSKRKPINMRMIHWCRGRWMRVSEISEIA